MKPYPSIHIEISGICNARCPYCTAGVRNQNKGSFMDTGLFRDVMKQLVLSDLGSKELSTLALYNWGEPFLHPEFNKIIDCINEFGFKYVFSTNASIIPEIDRNFTKNLASAVISMPGFSQYSYDKIHGFQFNEIKNNILQIVKSLRKYGYTGEIKISYHVYQFNLEEMVVCHEFCQDIGANFFPNYATLLDWWTLMDYFNNTIAVEKLKAMSQDLFMKFIDEDTYRDIKIDRCPMIHDYLIINEYGNVVTCCNLPNNHPDYSCGNILQDDIEEILRNKATKQICRECMERKFFSGPLRVPVFYYQMLSK